MKLPGVVARLHQDAISVKFNLPDELLKTLESQLQLRLAA